MGREYCHQLLVWPGFEFNRRGQMQPSVAQIGQRVSIRLHDPAGGYRDMLGILESENTLRKKDGTLVSFDPAKIAVWKVVPSK